MQQPPAAVLLELHLLLLLLLLLLLSRTHANAKSEAASPYLEMLTEQLGRRIS